MAMIHIKCHAQPVNTGFPAVLCGGRKEKNVRILKIKTKTGIKTVYNVIDWGWNAETGDLYYRSEKELHHKRCISVEEIIV
jgi:hypothetical protein